MWRQTVGSMSPTTSNSTPSFFSQFNTTCVQDWALEFRLGWNSDSHSKCYKTSQSF